MLEIENVIDKAMDDLIIRHKFTCESCLAGGDTGEEE